MLGPLSLPALTVAAVFATSGLGKLLALDGAANTLGALRLSGLPPRATVAAVSAAELVVAAGLLVATGPAAALAAAAAFALSLVFLAVGVRAQALASTDECGCFGPLGSTRVGPAMTARNAALAILAAIALIGVPTDERAPSILGHLLASPALGAVLVISAAGIAVIGASWNRSAPPVPEGTVPDAALITPDRKVVVPRQRALRGRAQLLLFVRRGCGSCENVIDRMTWEKGLLEALVDVRLIVAVGDSSPLTDADTGLHIDPSGEFAAALGIPGQRPVGVLLTTAGEVLRPVAVGGDETVALIDTVLAAAVEVPRPHTEEDSPTT